MALLPLDGTPGRPRSFDPARVAGLELRAWVGYYRRNWAAVLSATVGLVRAGFGMSLPRSLYGASLLLRASQLWAPKDNDPDGARRCMERFYALILGPHGEPGDVATAARLEQEVRARKGYDQARRSALARLRSGVELNWTKPRSRDELHER